MLLIPARASKRLVPLPPIRREWWLWFGVGVCQTLAVIACYLAIGLGAYFWPWW